MVSVSDTGHGLDEETKNHIFDPFFTTKENEKGTGLGISTVYGIVKQSGGYISVQSEIDKGTIFRCYFPRVNEAPKERTIKRDQNKTMGGFETILLVEDDSIVRNMISSSLMAFGYRVLESDNGNNALEICKEQNDNTMKLLITDVVMPGMSGCTLADRILKDYPEMKVLYISGYTDEKIVQHGVLEKAIPFLRKPFTPEELAKTIREILDKG